MSNGPGDATPAPSDPAQFQEVYDACDEDKPCREKASANYHLELAAISSKNEITALASAPDQMTATAPSISLLALVLRPGARSISGSLLDSPEGLPRSVRGRSFSHFGLNSSGLKIFGHSGQLDGPNSELFNNFRLDRGFLKITTSPRQRQKISYTLHKHHQS